MNTTTMSEGATEAEMESFLAEKETLRDVTVFRQARAEIRHAAAKNGSAFKEMKLCMLKEGTDAGSSVPERMLPVSEDSQAERLSHLEKLMDKLPDNLTI